MASFSAGEQQEVKISSPDCSLSVAAEGAAEEFESYSKCSKATDTLAPEGKLT